MAHYAPHLTLIVEYGDYYRYEDWTIDPVTMEVTITVREYQFHGREYPLELIGEQTEILK